MKLPVMLFALLALSECGFRWEQFDIQPEVRDNAARNIIARHGWITVGNEILTIESDAKRVLRSRAVKSIQLHRGFTEESRKEIRQIFPEAEISSPSVNGYYDRIMRRR